MKSNLKETLIHFQTNVSQSTYGYLKLAWEW